MNMRHLIWGALRLLLLLSMPQRLTGQAHDFSHVLSCQSEDPPLLLGAMFDDDEMFGFDFRNQSAVARMPEFQKWAGYPFDPEEVGKEAKLCQIFRNYLGGHLVNITPEATGTPEVELFTRHPLEFGKPNTLICFVSNFFPPTLNITWQRRDSWVTHGFWTTDYYPTQDLGFYAFSYLEFTPAANDRYTCVVRHGRDLYTTIKTWVPKNPLPSDLLENALCGLAFCVGIISVIAGIVLLILGRKPRQTD